MVMGNKVIDIDSRAVAWGAFIMVWTRAIVKIQANLSPDRLRSVIREVGAINNEEKFYVKLDFLEAPWASPL